MICNARHASNDNTTTANNCTTPGTSVSGRYNTPPLREDLVPRSRMAPEGNRREREEVKLSCFFDERVKPKNLEKVKPFREKNTTEMNKVESTPLRKGKRKNPIRVALRFRRDARLDKAKGT